MVRQVLIQYNQPEPMILFLNPPTHLLFFFFMKCDLSNTSVPFIGGLFGFNIFVGSVFLNFNLRTFLKKFSSTSAF